MSHIFEDYREISNVHDKLDFLIELVRSAPRRVFLTKLGEVQAILIGPEDYEDLWQIELERDMKLADEGESIPHEEVMRKLEELQEQLQARHEDRVGRKSAT